MTNKRKPFCPFENGNEPHDLNWVDVRLEVIGDKDEYVINGITKTGEVITLNMKGVVTYDE